LLPSARWGVTAMALLVAAHWIPFVCLAIGVLPAAGVKEFWFDVRYENGQTFIDNLEDW
jgi:hypothetical protein